MKDMRIRKMVFAALMAALTYVATMVVQIPSPMQGYVTLPPEQLHAMREESAAAEQAIFNDLSSRAAAWEEQAGKTLLLDKAIEYTRTTVVQHTANEWQTTEHNRHIRSNRVYPMNYYIYENTRYDKEAQKSIPYSWTLTWLSLIHISGKQRLKISLPPCPTWTRICASVPPQR